MKWLLSADQLCCVVYDFQKLYMYAQEHLDGKGLWFSGKCMFCSGSTPPVKGSQVVGIKKKATCTNLRDQQYNPKQHYLDLLRPLHMEDLKESENYNHKYGKVPITGGWETV